MDDPIRDPESPLNDYEKYLVEKILDPNNLTDKFKKWVTDYVPTNGKFDRATLIGSTALGGMAHIETKTLASAVSSVTFEVPQTFTHLKLLGLQDNDTGAKGIGVQYNGDTGTNYSWVEEYVTSADVAAYDPSGPTSAARVGVSYNQGVSAVFETTIFGYRSRPSGARSLGEWMAFDGSADSLRTIAGWWNSTAAITSLKVLVVGGGNFDVGSVFSLYGLI